MPMRTNRTTVTFARPFLLGGTDEELIEGLSFVAYRRVATYVRLHPRAGQSRTMTVDPVEFDAAVARDLRSGHAEEEVKPGC